MLIGRYYRLSLAPAPAAPPASSIAAWSYAQLPTATGLADEKNTGDPRAVQPGYALGLNGVNQNASFGTLIPTSSSLTFSFWMKARDTATTSRIAGQYTSLSGRTVVSIIAGGTLRYFAQRANAINTPIAQDVWVHVIATYDFSGSSELFVNNISQGTASGVGGSVEQSAFKFGSSSDDLNYFEGDVSDLAVMTAVATASERLWLYTSGREGTKPTMVLQSKLEESAGAIAYDSSGNGNHGTLVNGPTYTATGEVSRSWANDVGYSDGRNLKSGSEQFSNLTYFPNQTIAGTGVAPVRTADYAVAPDGSTTADRLQFDRGAGTSNGDYSLMGFAGTAVSPSSTIAISFYARSNTGVSQQMLAYNNSDASGQVFTVTTSWQRFTIPTVSSRTAFSTLFGTRGGSGSYFNGGQQSLDVLLWGYQAEAGSIVTPYQKTTTESLKGQLIPRDESDTDNDVLGSPLTYSGKVPRPSLAHSSPCRVFDGVDDYVSTGASRTGDWSVSLRFKSANTSMSAVIYYVSGLDTGGRPGLFACGSVNSQVAGFNDGNSSLTGTTAVNDALWHQLCVTKSGTSYEVFLDGSEEAAGTLLDVDISSLSIGHRGNGTFEFPGSLADVRVYNTALSATDVAKIYNQASDQPIPTVAWYPLSETGGTTAHNVIANANHGTVNGGATVGTQDVFHYALNYGHGGGANETPALADKSTLADGSAISNPAVIGHNAASTQLDFTSGQPNDPAIDTYVLTLDGTDDHVTPELRVTNTGSVTQVFASCWVKFSGTQNEKHIQGEYRTTSSHRQWRLATTPDGTTVEAQVYANGGATTYKAYGFTTALNDDKWHHVAMYFNAGVLKIYLNGLEEASPVQRSDGTVNSIWNGIAQYAIGAGNSSISASDFFAGDVQQCRVYVGSNAADAATNVAGIYEETYTGTPEAVYDLRNSLLDTSGNGDDLVAYGSPSFSRILPPTDYTFDSGLPLHMRRLKYSSVREAEYYIKG